MTVTELPDKIYQILSDKTNLTIGDIPSLTEEGVGIILLAGLEDDRYFGKRSLAKPMVQIPIRSKTYQSGMRRAEQIKGDLDGYTDDDILQCLISGSPTYLGRNQQKLHELTITFKIQLKE